MSVQEKAVKEKKKISWRGKSAVRLGKHPVTIIERGGELRRPGRGPPVDLTWMNKILTDRQIQSFKREERRMRSR